MRYFFEFLKNESGATAIEYSMIGAIVSVVIIGGVTSLGSSTNLRFSKLGSALQ